MRTHTSLTLFALLILIAWLVATVVSAPFKTHSAHALPALTQDDQDPASGAPTGEGEEDQDNNQDGANLESGNDGDNDQGEETQATEQEWPGFIDFEIIVRSLILVGVPGILGGIVAGRLRRSAKVGDGAKVGNGTIVGNLTKVGTNAIVGLLGAYAIFLIIPGGFEIYSGQAIKELNSLLEIIGLAAVGGFGGKAILTIVLNKALGAKVDELDEQQQKQSAKIESAIAAEKAAQKVLQDDEMALKKPEDVAALAKIFEKAPEAVIGKIFYSAREQRKDNEAPLMAPDYVGLNPGMIDYPAALTVHRKKIKATTNVFGALIKCDTKGVYPRNHAQLSYALAGLDKPKWEDAETQIREAIIKRDKNAETKGRNPIYEFQLACILIEIAKEAGDPGNVDLKLISELLSTAATEHGEKIQAALQRLAELKEGKSPNKVGKTKDDLRYERYASLLHFAASKPAAKELLEKLKAS